MSQAEGRGKGQGQQQIPSPQEVERALQNENIEEANNMIKEFIEAKFGEESQIALPTITTSIKQAILGNLTEKNILRAVYSIEQLFIWIRINHPPSGSKMTGKLREKVHGESKDPLDYSELKEMDELRVVLEEFILSRGRGGFERIKQIEQHTFQHLEQKRTDDRNKGIGIPFIGD